MTTRNYDDELLPRRRFIKASTTAGIACACFPMVELSGRINGRTHIAPQDAATKVYVCPPCGLDCDKLVFEKPGACTVCGMTLIEKSERDKLETLALKASKSPLAGSWAGTYSVGSERTAVRINFAGTARGLKGAVDFLGQNGGFDLAGLKTSDSGFSGEVSYTGKKLSFDTHLNDSRLEGRVTTDKQTGRVELVHLAPFTLRDMRPWEGIYRAGSRLFLFESLNEYYACNAVELPSGKIRNLFPVQSNRFIAGPALLEALPQEQSFTFFNGDEPVRKVRIASRRNRFTASQIALPSEEVKFKNGDVTLAGTLILPASPGPHPAIIFMHGSGGSPRVSYFGFGYWLASRGIAVLKYDKRGSGESTGSFTTYEDLADDAVAGARMLQSRAEIDRKGIGFWGISEGGWTAPEAASRFTDAAFVIVVSGGGLSPAEGEIYDTEDQLRSDGRFSEADIRQALAFQRARDHYAQKHEGWDEYAGLLKIALTKPWYNYPTTDLFGAAKADSAFWRSKARTYFYDPLPALRSVRCPFLGLRGGVDDPVGGRLGLTAMQQALAAAGNKDITMRMIPRANHELFEADSGVSAELARTKRFAPEVLPLMTQWLEKRVLRKRT